VLSPHPDDAVFSAWAALTARPAPLVVTVFAGVPEPGFVTSLDRDHGAAESAAWVRRRRNEDAAVLAAAGCRVVHGDLPDLQYRVRELPELRRAVERDPGQLLSLARDEPRLQVPPGDVDGVAGALLGPSTVVHGPAGIGGHPDHEAVARYAVSLVPRVAQVRLYADSPYYLRDGLPAWVTGERRIGSAADDALGHAFARLGLDPGRAAPEVVRLDDERMAAKDRAMRGYRTEFDPVNRDFDGIAANSALMRHEVYWMLR
jgi:LmbE family N-acetylglucosaminyl deacetylase